MNLLILGTLVAFGEGWLYLMWVVSYVFVNPLISRIRQVAEHAAVPDRLSPDPRRNTRTVLANPFERMIFAPHRVNYHLEHHLLASVPCYRLRRLPRDTERKRLLRRCRISRWLPGPAAQGNRTHRACRCRLSI